MYKLGLEEGHIDLLKVFSSGITPSSNCFLAVFPKCH